MIVFDLKCVRSHVFEAWFRSSGDFDQQQGRGIIECPTCGSHDVTKAVMAPNVTAKGNQRADTGMVATDSIPPEVTALLPDEIQAQSYGAPALPRVVQQQLDEVMAKVQAHIEENCDYVGDTFAEEARRIHYGETQERGIYGVATVEESMELLDEGIDVMPLPYPKRTGRADA